MEIGGWKNREYKQTALNALEEGRNYSSFQQKGATTGLRPLGWGRTWSCWSQALSQAASLPGAVLEDPLEVVLRCASRPTGIAIDWDRVHCCT